MSDFHIPAPAEVRAAREAAGLTQSEAAAMVCRTLRNWQQWESGERAMDPTAWRLYTLLLAQQLANPKSTAKRHNEG